MSESLHWLRPWWLLALLPVLLLLWLAWRQQRHQRSAWRRHIDPHLLPHLLQPQPGGVQRWPLWLLAAGWLLAVIALAGPVWQRIELPLYQSQQATVLVLNLSPVMTVRDESPDRLSRARHKIQDLIAQLKGSQLALLIYADSPFVAAPLTDDGQVILNMLPELSGDLMPPLGERADLALTRAAELLAGAGAVNGRIILLSPGLGDAPEQTLAAAAAAAEQGYSVSVLGLGSEAGGAFRDRWGRSQLSRRDSQGLAQLAEEGGGRYAQLSADDSDWQQLLAGGDAPAQAAEGQGQEGQGAQWQEQGHWLLLLPLLCAPLAFRRGWLAVVLACGLGSSLLLAPTAAEASWRDWWQTADQQASDAFAAGQYEAASQQFRDPAWAAAARYKAGDYQQAARDFQAQGGVAGHYNAGNALARAGDYQQALAAYDEALKLAPAHEDARVNRELVAKLLQQQQQQNQQNQQQDGQQQDGQQQDKAQSGDQQQAQNGEQQQAEQQQQNEQQPSDRQQSAKQQDDNQQLQQQMDKALAEAEQQGQEQDAEQQGEAHASPQITAEQQAREQLLRQVPDDHTGLLRARIYHHYRNPRNRQ